MGKTASRMPAKAPFLSNKDCMKAFAYFDKDDTGLMEFGEMQEAFNTMLAPAEVDISCYGEDSTFTPAKFKAVAEETNIDFPQYDVAGNLMKFIRENAEAADDDNQDITDKALQKVFTAYDKDGSGELSILEMFKLFEFLKIRLSSLFEQKAVDDGTVTFEEFCELCRSINEKYPGYEVDEKIMGLAATLGDGAPDIDDQPDPDPDNDPAVEADQAADEDAASLSGNKKALLVGINYIGSSCELGGCINDVRNELKVLTENYGFDEGNILLLTEDQDDDSKLPTAQNIRDGFTWLLDGAAEGDFLFFAYSGHGSQMADRTGNEPDGKNEILCPLDLQEDWDANSIHDDYLNDIFFDQLPSGVRCLLVYDCCHSGSMTDLSCTRDLTPPGDDCDVTDDQGARFLEPPEDVTSAIEEARQAAQDAGCMKRAMTRDLGDFDGKLLWTISGCQDNQTSADATIGGVRQGAMTWALLEALGEGGTRGPWTFEYEPLVTTMRKKLKRKRFSQIPALCTTDAALLSRLYLGNKGE